MDELDKELMYVPTATPWRTRLSVGLRVKFFLTGIVYPACCLMWSVGGLKPFLGGDLWQDGQTNTYVEANERGQVQLTLFAEPTWPANTIIANERGHSQRTGTGPINAFC